MSLRFRLDPEQDRRLLDGFVRLWTDVVNAGGAVGFVPPVTTEDVRPDALLHLAAVAEGRTRQLVGFDEEGEVRATAHFTFNKHRLMRHWVGLYTVMVDPSLQGRGVGRELMAAAEREARAFDGIRAIRLTCRGGLGLEHFYASCGYKEVGRAPEAIKVAEDDYRDDITMWLPLP
ncbi:GNAT family N-acetyltransferase [Streptomyces alkaliterrae]|uniref:GNAT family N-acetyltransferase n=1 Tax=Streptomyces alkaliterrae TaxID=2213162 RepID=A0A5P0YXP2_9ACTN|nr:GNAT family N-acetyltransferase [Streptomyces alkaliterrae]MBB1253217.1 GNAT family N-acetyltransferase [Streptomyces alkaliterrae]MBB1257393.1 GNAT family N-acetyltransferase [Streptomyces alkaliterrae]MQS05055.1 GNAT family N-acetyltransferase [Streptomyces alkaliterrae]